VVFVSTAAVVEKGVPVRLGLARLAFRSSADCKSVWVERVPVMAPQATEVAGVTPPTLTTQEVYVPDPVW
jgi:hypothetical protein